jgi:hypothetical protein
MEDIKCSNWLSKGFDGQPDNFIPVRAPLDSTIDQEVVKRMKGFGFGTDQEVTSILREEISKSNGRTPKTPIEPSGKSGTFFNFGPQGKFDVKGLGRALKHRSERGSFSKPSLPSNSLISIYYLVREKMERECKLIKADNVPIPEERGMLSDDSEDVLPIALRGGSVDGIMMRPRRLSMDEPRMRVRDNSIVSIDGTRTPPSSPCARQVARTSEEFIVDNIPHSRSRSRPRNRRRASSMGELSVHSKEGEVRAAIEASTRKRRFRRGKRNTQKASTGDLELSADDLIVETDVGGSSISSPSGKKMLSSKISTMKKKVLNFKGRGRSSLTEQLESQPLSPCTPSDVPSDVESDVSPHSPLPASLLTSGKLFLSISPPSNSTKLLSSSPPGLKPPGITFFKPGEDSATSSSTPLHRKSGKFTSMNMGVVQTINRQGKKIQNKFSKNSGTDTSHDNIPGSSGDLVIKSPPDTHQVDSVLKSVFLKGLFSVATSSTKSAASIRKELLRVFDSLGIDYNETTGCFECRFVSVEETGAGDESIASVPQSPLTDDEDIMGKAVAAEGEVKPNWKRIVVFECYIVKSIIVILC